MTMPARPRKMKPYTRRWERLANAEARSFAPTIYACRKCGYPVVTGYCCTNCRDVNPSYKEER